MWYKRTRLWLYESLKELVPGKIVSFGYHVGRLFFVVSVEINKEFPSVYDLSIKTM